MNIHIQSVVELSSKIVGFRSVESQFSHEEFLSVSWEFTLLVVKRREKYLKVNVEKCSISVQNFASLAFYCLDRHDLSMDKRVSFAVIVDFNILFKKS